MFVQPSAATPAITLTEDPARPEPAGILGNGHGLPAVPVEIGLPAGAADAPPPAPRQKRGRPRTGGAEAGPGGAWPSAAGAAAEAALVAETGAVVCNLQRQGVLKPPSVDHPGGGPGHRTKNCRPVQINLSETMFRQLKMIAATQSISIKDQIIAALLQQGYKA